MFEAQAFIALFQFLANREDIRFTTKLSRASRQFVITCLPEVIQYLLRTFGTSSAMREVIEDLRNTSRGSLAGIQKKTERGSVSLWIIHSEDENIKLYIYWLAETYGLN